LQISRSLLSMSGRWLHGPFLLASSPVPWAPLFSGTIRKVCSKGPASPLSLRFSPVPPVLFFIFFLPTFYCPARHAPSLRAFPPKLCGFVIPTLEVDLGSPFLACFFSYPINCGGQGLLFGKSLRPLRPLHTFPSPHVLLPSRRRNSFGDTIVFVFFCSRFGNHFLFLQPLLKGVF